jgi:hypothetical protein
MAAPKPSAGRYTHSVAGNLRLVTISGITTDGLTAICTDRSGFEARVPLLNMPAKGVLPAVGENWYISQESGYWNFAAFIGSAAGQLAAQVGGENGGGGATAPSAFLLQNSTMSVSAALPVGSGTSQVPGSTVSQAGSALNLNPYFASGDLTGWQAYGGALSATQKPTGPFPWSAKIVAGSTAAFGVMGTNSNVFAVTLGNSYLVSAWVYVNGGSLPFAQIGVDWLSSSFGVITTETSNISVPVNTWTPVSSVVSTSNGSVAYGRPRCGSATATGAGMQVYVGGLIVLPEVPGGLITAGTITAAQIAAGIIIAGIVDGTQISAADFLQYFGAPALGSLTGSWSSAGGTDDFGNPYGAGMNLESPQQINFTGPDGSVMSLIPAAQEQITLTSLVSGFYQVAVTLATTDVNQEAPATLSSVLLNSGAASQQMASLWHSPNQGTGSGIIMLSQSDDATLPPTILMCQVMTSGDVDTITPIAAFTPYAFLVYGGSSGQVVVTKTSGSGTIPIPASVSVAKAECEAGGGGGGNGNATVNGGGGGGEYACEPSLAVTPGGTVSYTVGTFGAGGAQSNGGLPAHGGNGANSTMTGTSVTVTGHAGGGAGLGSGNQGTAGSGSTNTIHHSGGTGGLGLGGHADDGGGGGGASAGPTAAGGSGGAGTTGAGGAGGTAPSGGGAGGRGGAPPSNSGIQAGSNYGGGGGGGSYHNATGIAYAGFGGAPGFVRLTYSTGTPSIMFSVASAAGTDPFGSAYSAGAKWINPADSNTYLVGKKRVHGTATQVINSATQTLCPGLTMTLQPGNYAFEVWVPFTADTATYAAYVTMGGTLAPTTGGFIANLVYWWNSGSIAYQQTTLGSNTGLPTGILSTGRTYMAYLKGRVVVQTAGTLTVVSATSGGDGHTIQLGSIFEIEPDS